MERLTEWGEFGNADIIALSDMMPEIYAELSFSETCALTEALNRLAQYEDALPLERAQELAQAEKGGRLVVLPCKVGDTVYVIYGEGYITCTVDRMHIIANNQVQVRMRNFLIETLWMSVSEFGKTVFLTHEEAEAALKKRAADNEAD